VDHFVGSAGLTAHFCFTRAFRIADARLSFHRFSAAAA